MRDIWNKWFDEVFPPTPSDSEYTDEEEMTEEQTEEKQEEDKKKKRLVLFRQRRHKPVFRY